MNRDSKRTQILFISRTWERLPSVSNNIVCIMFSNFAYKNLDAQAAFHMGPSWDSVGPSWAQLGMLLGCTLSGRPGETLMII